VKKKKQGILPENKKKGGIGKGGHGGQCFLENFILRGKCFWGNLHGRGPLSSLLPTLERAKGGERLQEREKGSTIVNVSKLALNNPRPTSLISTSGRGRKKNRKSRKQKTHPRDSLGKILYSHREEGGDYEGGRKKKGASSDSWRTDRDWELRPGPASSFLNEPNT